MHELNDLILVYKVVCEPSSKLLSPGYIEIIRILQDDFTVYFELPL